jgi:hypothetical protein
MKLLLAVPPFVQALKSVLNDLSSWMLLIVPAVLALSLAWAGIQLQKSDDGVEKKRVKDRLTQAVIGAMLSGSAVWIADYLVSKFS